MFGAEWEQTAYVCTMIGNGLGGKKHGKPFKPAEFMPAVLRPKPREQSGTEQLTIFRAIAARSPATK